MTDPKTNETRVTISGNPADPTYAAENGAPQPIDPDTGQHHDYWVLSPEERAKGFIRPVRFTYIHVGVPAPEHPMRDLTDEEKVRFADNGYVKFEVYQAGGNVTGRFWTQKELDSVNKGCKTSTTMSRPLAETYARQPGFYGSTFCSGCRTHLPVGKRGEFVWQDTNERVGT